MCDVGIDQHHNQLHFLSILKKPSCLSLSPPGTAFITYEFYAEANLAATSAAQSCYLGEQWLTGTYHPQRLYLMNTNPPLRSRFIPPHIPFLIPPPSSKLFNWLSFCHSLYLFTFLMCVRALAFWMPP